MTRVKILSLGQLKKNVAMLRRQKKQIAFTNGCFDILHFGHVSYLKKAKKGNRVLIVGLNSDRSIREIKGHNRPIIPQAYRAGLLAALECVDFITIFNEPTPLKLIEAIKPDVLIKGADWKGKDVVGAGLIKEYGGKVELIQYLKGFSTTNIIETILNKCRK